MSEPDTCELLCLDLTKGEALRASMPDLPTLELWAQHGKALSDPTRLAVLLALHDGGACCVCDLGWVLGKDEKLVSHHLRLLKSAGIACSRREGRMVLYELTDAGAALLDAFVPAQQARA